MTKADFGMLYRRLEAAYGTRITNVDQHFDLWWIKFGNWPRHLFEEAVNTVLDAHRAYGSDKWPTIGDFNYIVSQHGNLTKETEPDGFTGKDPKEREYHRIQWRIRQLPIETRNRLLRDAINRIVARDVPDYMKPLAGPPGEYNAVTMNAMIENMKVRIYCHEEGIPCPLR